MEGFTITGQDNINKARLIALKFGLTMEIKGIRMSSRGRTCYSIIKSEFGLKGNRQRVLDQFTELIEPKRVVYETIELNGVETSDYPDFCNAYAVYAEWTDGTELTEEELDNIPGDVIHERAHEEFH